MKLPRFGEGKDRLYPGDSKKTSGEENGGNPMKTVTAHDLQKKIKACLDEAQEGRVVITRRGKPTGVLIGVEGKDWETVILETDPRFWRLIQERRTQPTISVKELHARLHRKR